MSGRFDLCVVGGGPAGVAAALAAYGAGLRVVVLDEGAGAGGQIGRAPRTRAGRAAARRSGDARTGERLRAALAASGVEARFGRRAWSVTAGFRVDALGPDGPEAIEADRLLAATGAHERVIPFPGWTLPGVVGLAAATVLLKTEGRLPGRRVVVAGAGPLLAAVAAGIVRGGGTVAALVDLAGPGDWARASPALASKPGLLAKGVAWAAAIARARTPFFPAHAVVEAAGDGALERVIVAPVDGAGRPDRSRARTIEADLLAIGHGLVPGAEVTRLLRAEHAYDEGRGGIAPVLDADGRTTVPGLYAAGDGAGIAGAGPAEAAGRLAGLAAARDAGRLDDSALARQGAEARAELARSRRFSAAVARLMRPRPGLLAALAPDTIVCRCEDVTAGALDEAVAAGARDLNQLKHFTRCGMGPCQGRYCGEAAAALLAARLGTPRGALGAWTARPPLRPVGLGDLVGAFGYDDIPVPPPAPL